MLTEEQYKEALQEIRANLTPDQVFTPDQLIQWARDHMEPHQIYDLPALKATIVDLKSEII